MIRLFVIEDHAPIIVAGLKRMFYASRDGIEVTGESRTIEEALKTANTENFDIFLLDLWLENKRPAENIRELHSHFPDKPVIIYTSETSPVWKRKMFEEQAMAYVLKTSERAEIRKAIESVSRGNKYWADDLFITDQGKSVRGSEHHVQNLSPVEKEILLLLKEGESQTEIADFIGKSKSFVEKILRDLRSKFKARNNFELLNNLTEFL